MRIQTCQAQRCWFSWLLACLLFASAAGHACALDDLQRFEFTRIVMGTRGRVVVYADDRAKAVEAAAAAFERMAALEQVMSDYRSDSELSLVLAHPPTEPIAVSPDFAEVLRTAMYVSRKTDGAFDPGVAPLVALWRESRRTARLPSPEALTDAKTRATTRGLMLDMPDSGAAALRVDRPISLDFGGIGKGFAVGQARDVLRRMGLPICLAAIGGDLAVGDPPPSAAGWRIVVDTGEPGDVAAQVLVLANTCVSTSGHAEQFVEIEGVRYSHIVDPATGLGSTRRVTATVIHPKPGVADALATAICVLGARAGMECARHEFVEAIVWTHEIVDDETIMLQTPGMPSANQRESADATIADMPAGLRSLFDGRTLAGWRAVADDPPKLATLSPERREVVQAQADARLPHYWRVENGEIRFERGWLSLQTIDVFEDFELFVEWKIEKDGDSGIYLRGLPQVQIWDNPIGSGGLYNNVKGPSNPLVAADAPIGEWNRFHIIMRGDRVTVHLNDVLVVDDVPLENYWDRAAPIPTKGPIELQAHDTPLWFRRIYVREL